MWGLNEGPGGQPSGQPGGHVGRVASLLGGCAHVPQTSPVPDAPGAVTRDTRVTHADPRMSLRSAQGGVAWKPHQLGFGLQPAVFQVQGLPTSRKSVQSPEPVLSSGRVGAHAFSEVLESPSAVLSGAGGACLTRAREAVAGLAGGPMLSLECLAGLPMWDSSQRLRAPVRPVLA